MSIGPPKQPDNTPISKPIKIGTLEFSIDQFMILKELINLKTKISRASIPGGPNMIMNLMKKPSPENIQKIKNLNTELSQFFNSNIEPILVLYGKLNQKEKNDIKDAFRRGVANPTFAQEIMNKNTEIYDPRVIYAQEVPTEIQPVPKTYVTQTMEDSKPSKEHDHRIREVPKKEAILGEPHPEIPQINKAMAVLQDLFNSAVPPESVDLKFTHTVASSGREEFRFVLPLNSNDAVKKQFLINIEVLNDLNIPYELGKKLDKKGNAQYMIILSQPSNQDQIDNIIEKTKKENEEYFYKAYGDSVFRQRLSSDKDRDNKLNDIIIDFEKNIQQNKDNATRVPITLARERDLEQQKSRRTLEKIPSPDTSPPTPSSFKPG